ncbi:response regulator transcription factor [Demequina sp. TTPB684]|uniref:response regulator n=1 Tax=unclassified Demequina TaxID=2620311 RepID=UPI001CF5EFA2|nr:response regulator transcription factor [Demequina sp. TMPB413]MCB2411442.1 response regulator transcription factor [Demequina sp. TTPB684]UPU88356.1 response regulator transcription factor [Demequina sp. TMPB413]
MIRVGLVDDQQMVRVGLKMILESEDDIVVCCEAASGEEAIAGAAEHRPDVILMDIRMPGMDGLAATREVLKLAPDSRVVILTTFDDDEYLYGALRAGASGFLLKSADGDSLVNAVRVVAGGEALLAPEVTRRVIEQFARGPVRSIDDAGAASESVPLGSSAATTPAPFPGLDVADLAEEHIPSPEAIGDLSDREVQVLQLMARGMSNQEIAKELFVSNTTVKTHVSHILTKLGVRDRVQAVVEAYDSGIVIPKP